MILVARPLSVWLCLIPFPQMTARSKHFVSWVGLRGAVPIIFATYPVVAKIEGANLIFNIVFFITILSLVIQGSTIPWIARRLRLATKQKKEGNDFGVELPEEIDTNLKDIVLNEEMLIHGNTLKEIKLPDGTLVMLVKRGNDFLIPNGSLELESGDKLLLMRKN